MVSFCLSVSYVLGIAFQRLNVREAHTCLDVKDIHVMFRLLALSSFDLSVMHLALSGSAVREGLMNQRFEHSEFSTLRDFHTPCYFGRMCKLS